MLVGEMKQLHQQVIKNENWLAQLHADIYQRREEARKIRLSLPASDLLENLTMTEHVLERLEKKKNKTLCSLQKLHQKTQQNIDHYTTRANQSCLPISFYLIIFVLVILLIVFIYYVYSYYTCK